MTKRQEGFTLVEIIAVIAILGIVSFFAVARFNESGTAVQSDIALKKILSDIQYARDLATTGGQGTRVYIDQSQNRYYLKWADDTYIKNPFGGSDFVVAFGSHEYQAIQIASTGFTGGRLDFNRSGLPLNGGVAFSGTKNVVTLNNGKGVWVTAGTGLLSTESP